MKLCWNMNLSCLIEEGRVKMDRFYQKNAMSLWVLGLICWLSLMGLAHQTFAASVADSATPSTEIALAIHDEKWKGQVLLNKDHEKRIRHLEGKVIWFSGGLSLLGAFGGTFLLDALRSRRKDGKK